jgi:hypothetical protein
MENCMREITPVLTDELKKHCGKNDVSKAPLYEITKYNDLVKLCAELSYLNKDSLLYLVKLCAELSYLNKDSLLFFRGQSSDYLNQNGSTTIYPSIYRSKVSAKYELKASFEILDRIGRDLAIKAKNKGINGAAELQKKKYIQWSIIQHYEMWKTPLLDITHSISVACTFAQYDNDGVNGVIYVLALPYYSNRISINSEHDIVNIRLLSISPPSALRPFFQEGYLIGTTDVTYDYDDKTELDFKRRLVAKISIPNTLSFWGKNNRPIDKSLIYPKNDDFGSLCSSITSETDSFLEDSDYGALIREWSNLERISLNKYRKQENNTSRRIISMSQLLKWLYEQEEINSDDYITINKIKSLRNKMVHEGYTDISKKEINEYINIIKNYNNRINK